MGNIKEIIWKIEPHTEAKHAILRKYLDAWLPIITKYKGRVVIIDGFAGPGIYKDGQEGSPIIAIKSVLEHKFKFNSEIKLLFIEKDKNRYNSLEENLKKIELKEKIEYTCTNDEFVNVINGILNKLESNGSKIAPTFTFIDPFGFSGIPIKVIKRIMENPSCEVLITFMYDEINRFIKLPINENNCNELFGTEKWKEILKNNHPNERLSFLHKIYLKQLKKSAKIKYVRSFKMFNKFNKCDYLLFFGTNNLLGLEKMKEAMWRIDPSGRFEFSDATYDPQQTTLLEHKPNYSKLKSIILEEFKGKKVNVKELGDFIVINTPFLRTHFKKNILAPMEKNNEIKIEYTKKRRKGSYPDEATIEFL